MRKTLREEILSVNIKKDNTYDEILDIIDDYCRKNHKNTSIRFALGFYYLFLAKVDREAENYDEDLHMILVGTSLRWRQVHNVPYSITTHKDRHCIM